MPHQNIPIDPEIEAIKSRLLLGAIALTITVMALFIGLPMWAGVPVVGIGSFGVWYGLVKMKESKQNDGVKS